MFVMKKPSFLKRLLLKLQAFWRKLSLPNKTIADADYEKINKPKEVHKLEHPVNLPSTSQKLKISSDNILWIEKEILNLNRIINNSERPDPNPDFLQSLPAALLEKDVLTEVEIEKAAIQLIRQTRLRTGELKLPSKIPQIEIVSNLLLDAPGHIETSWEKAVIKIQGVYRDNPFAVASILCHELAHFILNYNGLRKTNRDENERFTDLFVFRCGQGLIYLQGVYDVKSEANQRIEDKDRLSFF
jgi:hypothetical protein